MARLTQAPQGCMHWRATESDFPQQSNDFVNYLELWLIWQIIYYSLKTCIDKGVEVLMRAKSGNILPDGIPQAIRIG